MENFSYIDKRGKAGMELSAPVSVLFSFAIHAAKRWNITLCGFVHPNKLNAYTHLQRIRNKMKRSLG